MILCVTLNPCLDKTLTVPAWLPGDNVRGTDVEEVVGGKGNNVARALHRLGHDDVRPATFLGGHVGAHCTMLLRESDGLAPYIVATGSLTRVILTVRGGDTATPDTAFFDPDPSITPDEADRLLTWVGQTLEQGDCRIVTLSGSSPSPATHTLYARMIAAARAAGIPLLLDTYGPALDAVRDAWPDAIHVNRKEAARHLGEPETDERLSNLLRDWSSNGVRLGVITDGPNPVLASLKGRLVRATPPRIDEVNPVGSGDCLLAGLADAWLRQVSLEDRLRFALAAGAANAATWTAGAIDRACVEALVPGVRVDPL